MDVHKYNTTEKDINNKRTNNKSKISKIHNTKLMETQKEYLERYLTWLRIQKGKALTKEARNEVNQGIVRTKEKLKTL